MRVDVVFDTICPWCYVGKRRLEAARLLRPNVEITPRWRPFLLNPDMPGEGMERDTYLVRKFGTEARVRRIYGAIGDAGQSVEIDFAFDRIRQTPNSVNSHRLVQFAENHGQTNAVADAVVEALFLNYFINGKDIGDDDVLIKIGVDIGLDENKLGDYLSSDEDVSFVYEENARAHRRGINSVPSYVLGGSMVISGAHEPQVLARLIDAAAAPSA
ncbi:MAG: DsbA family oxidoreductase [Rhodospirillales bacterium]|nr:DsbA family oxidoreductase [Rhodospirillales bacterium]